MLRRGRWNGSAGDCNDPLQGAAPVVTDACVVVDENDSGLVSNGFAVVCTAVITTAEGFVAGIGSGVLAIFPVVCNALSALDKVAAAVIAGFRVVCDARSAAKVVVAIGD